MDEELLPKKRRPRTPRKPTPRLGDVPVSMAARKVLQAMELGASLMGLRTFPFDWKFQLHAPDKMPESITNTLVDVLVRTRCIETTSDLCSGDDHGQSVARWTLTVRGSDAANGRGFDATPEQIDWTARQGE